MSIDIERYVLPGLCSCCGRTPPIWTPDEIVGAVLAWHANYGRVPSRDDWARASLENPSIQTVERVFGGMSAAILAAGLAPRKPGPEMVWTQERIVLAIQHHATLKGGPPRQKDWSASAPWHPTFTTVRERFGSWNAAIKAAGFIPERRGGRRGRRPRAVTA